MFAGIRLYHTGTKNKVLARDFSAHFFLKCDLKNSRSLSCATIYSTLSANLKQVAHTAPIWLVQFRDFCKFITKFLLRADILSILQQQTTAFLLKLLADRVQYFLPVESNKFSQVT